jgi:hypothetical protein
MTKEIEKAFKEFDNGKLWRPEDRFSDGFPQAYFTAGYKAGAKAKEQEHAAAIKAERARVLKEVEKLADCQTGYDVADDALERVREAIQKLKEAQ